MHKPHTSTPRRQFLQATTAVATMGLTGLAGLSPAQAQAPKWPAKPIRIVVAFPPGGLTDALARSYGEHLSTRLGVPVVIDNKGANSISPSGKFF